MQFAIDQACWMVVLLGFYTVVRTDLKLPPLKARTGLECFCFFFALPPCRSAIISAILATTHP